MKEKGYEDQLLLGASRFGVDYPSQMLVPLDVSGRPIAFADFVPDRRGRLCIDFFDAAKRDYRYQRYEPEGFYRLALPARVFSGPFSGDDGFIRQTNRHRKRNGFLLLDRATIARIDDNVLPRILINGKHWEADGENGVLHDPVNKGTIMRFPFNDSYLFNEGSSYHRDEWMMYPYKPGQGFLDDFVWEEYLDVPVNIMFVKMLGVESLDPVGRAIGDKRLPGAYLYDRLHRPYHKAVPVTWTKSYFSTIVNENRAGQKLPPLPDSAFRISIRKENDEPKRQMNRGRKHGM